MTKQSDKLVEWLRENAPHSNIGLHLTEAADEIERLQRYVAALEGVTDSQGLKIAQARAAVEPASQGIPVGAIKELAKFLAEQMTSKADEAEWGPHYFASTYEHLIRKFLMKVDFVRGVRLADEPAAAPDESIVVCEKHGTFRGFCVMCKLEAGGYAEPPHDPPDPL